jgi:hypothetical protein
MTGFPSDPDRDGWTEDSLREDPDHPGRNDLTIFYAPQNGLTIQYVWKNYYGRGDSVYEEITIGETIFYVETGEEESFINIKAQDNDLGTIHIAEFKLTADYPKKKAITVKVKEGSAKRLNDEWERLAETCGFSRKDFTEAAVHSFCDSFDGFHLLYGLADRRQRLITDYYLALKKTSNAAGFPLENEEQIRQSFDAMNKKIRSYYPQRSTAIRLENACYLAPKKTSIVAGFPLEREEKIRHPDFGKSFHAKNKKIRSYYPQNGTAIRFESSEWYCEGDTDVECEIVIGRAKFFMGCSDLESYVSMDINNDEVGTLCTWFEETSCGKCKPVGTTMECGDVKRMNREWERLAGSCGLTREEFTEAAIATFGEFWFGGFRLLEQSALENR